MTRSIFPDGLLKCPVRKTLLIAMQNKKKNYYADNRVGLNYLKEVNTVPHFFLNLVTVDIHSQKNTPNFIG